MKNFRRKFLRNTFLILSVLPFIKLDFFFSNNQKLKLKKNKDFIWYLNSDD